MSWPFRDWHTAAVRGLRLSPSEFWDMPLADWLALIAPTHTPLRGEELRALMENHPDE